MNFGIFSEVFKTRALIQVLSLCGSENDKTPIFNGFEHQNNWENFNFCIRLIKSLRTRCFLSKLLDYVYKMYMKFLDIELSFKLNVDGGTTMGISSS